MWLYNYVLCYNLLNLFTFFKKTTMYTDETDFYAVEKGTRKILNYRSNLDNALDMMKFYPNAELVVAIHRQYSDGDIKSFFGYSWDVALRAANAGIENYHEFFG